MACHLQHCFSATRPKFFVPTAVKSVAQQNTKDPEGKDAKTGPCMSVDSNILLCLNNAQYLRHPCVPGSLWMVQIKVAKQFLLTYQMSSSSWLYHHHGSDAMYTVQDNVDETTRNKNSSETTFRTVLWKVATYRSMLELERQANKLRNKQGCASKPLCLNEPTMKYEKADKLNASVTLSYWNFELGHKTILTQFVCLFVFVFVFLFFQ